MHISHPTTPRLLFLPLLLEMLFAIQQQHTHRLRQTEEHTHRKNRRALVLHRLLLRGMKKVLYVARTPIQLWLQPATACLILIPPDLLVSVEMGGRGSNALSRGTSAVLLAAGTGGISVGAVGWDTAVSGRARTGRWSRHSRSWLVLPVVEGEGRMPCPGLPTN